MSIVRQWRHTKMLKRAGQGFDPGGVAATAPRSLAIPCRACPLPNVNLPKGWENVAPERACVCRASSAMMLLIDISRWIYMLMVAMDANFRLKSRLRGSLNREPMLGLGLSYFVNNSPYSDFIKDYIDEEEVCP